MAGVGDDRDGLARPDSDQNAQAYDQTQDLATGAENRQGRASLGAPRTTGGPVPNANQDTGPLQKGRSEQEHNAWAHRRQAVYEGDYAANTKWLTIVLLDQMEDQGGQAIVTEKELATLTSLGTRTVSKYKDLAEEAGLIVCVSNGANRDGVAVNLYLLGERLA